MIKPRLSAEEPEATKALVLLGYLFEGALRLLSPFMPFISEEIWQAMYEGKPPAKSIALVAYPQLEQKWLNDAAEEQMAILQELIITIRNMRAELKIEPKLKTPVKIHGDACLQKLVQENRGILERLANVEGIDFVSESLARVAGARTTPRFEAALVYERKIDVAAERERLNKELTRAEGQLANLTRQLEKEQFLSKAPAHVVEGMRKQAAELKLLIEKIRRALDNLG